MTQPESVVSDGNVLVLWVTTISNINAPTVAELTAGTVLDVTCYLTDAGWQPNLAEDKVTDNRLCSTDNYEAPGRKTYTIPLVYVSNPKTPADDEAALTLLEGTLGYFVDRRGVPFETPVTAGDIVTVFPVKVGAQQDSPPTANTPLTVMQNAYLRQPGRAWRKAVV